ncbi:auxin-responsive protein SAUR62 [Manihot esculenta]|uniref:Uncharacterized protein n=1 Tax=Manihot esculenta TaxID=3983 RepID=A0A2C9U074_MANES|nr:auxin-responsive protein SAUR62 [Manihot esculenta]OAY22543.1 hypothetical protein MANES_18G006940v8 [Manihot esculenta]
MRSPKEVIKIAAKWQNVASSMRKIKVQVAQKGHFVVYSNDKKRFVVPLDYLNHRIFKELFKMSEEEFGLPGKGPITFPYDAVFVEYLISLVKQHASEDSFITMIAYRRRSFDPLDLSSQLIALLSF